MLAHVVPLDKLASAKFKIIIEHGNLEISASRYDTFETGDSRLALKCCFLIIHLQVNLQPAGFHYTGDTCIMNS